MSPQKNTSLPHGNYSIKPPSSSWSPGKHGDLKFNYKTLQFERVEKKDEKKSK